MIYKIFNFKRFKEASNNLKFNSDLTDQLNGLVYVMFDYIKNNENRVIDENPIVFKNPYKPKPRVIKISLDPDPDKRDESGLKLMAYYNIEEQKITFYPNTIIKTKSLGKASKFIQISVLNDLEYYTYHEFAHVVDPKLEEGNPLAGSSGTYGSYVMSETEFDANSKAACQYIKNYMNFNTKYALPEVENWLRNEDLNLTFLPMKIQSVITAWKDHSEVLYMRFRKRVFNDYEEIQARVDKEESEAKKNEM